jgi:hypothetical protein
MMVASAYIKHSDGHVGNQSEYAQKQMAQTLRIRDGQEIAPSQSEAEEKKPEKPKNNIGTDKVCRICGKHFTKEHPNQKYCCGHCAKIAIRENWRRYYRRTKGGGK